jgi:hypothetical protein
LISGAEGVSTPVFQSFILGGEIGVVRCDLFAAFVGSADDVAPGNVCQFVRTERGELCIVEKRDTRDVLYRLRSALLASSVRTSGSTLLAVRIRRHRNGRRRASTTSDRPWNGFWWLLCI